MIHFISESIVQILQVIVLPVFLLNLFIHSSLIISLMYKSSQHLTLENATKVAFSENSFLPRSI